MITAGIMLRFWAVGYLDRRASGSVYFTADALVTGGPFAYCRNPLYAANLIHALALVLVNGNPLMLLFWAVIVWFYISIVREEEQFLARRFGDTYLRYKASVPRFLPRLSPYREASGSFSWKRVWHKEYQSAITPVLLALLFHFAKQIEPFSFFSEVML